MKASSPGGHRDLTCSAVWPVEGCLCAVAGVTAPLFHTSPSIMADAVAGAVTRTAGIHPRGGLCTFIQVKGNPVNGEGT